MNPALAVAYGLSHVAACEGLPRKVVLVCTYCLDVLDPKWEHPVHRAPDDSECERCSDPVRWRMGGFVFAVLPA